MAAVARLVADRFEVNVGPVRAAQLDDAVGSCLGEIGGQIDAEVAQRGDVLAQLAVLAPADL